jgi:hypothetical protein
MATSRIDDLRIVDPVLTTLAQGFENPEFVADHLFPTVKVSKLKGKIPFFGKDAFLVRSTDRAIRSQSNRIMPSDFELISFETRERDIETAIDYLEEEETADYFRYEQRITKNLSDILKLGKEIEAAQLAQDINNYSLDMYSELDEEDAFNNPDSSPLTIIKNAMNSIRNKIARYPNTIVMGVEVFDALIRHKQLTDLVKYSGFASVSKEIIAKILNVDNIVVGMSVHTTDGTNFTDIWGNNMVLAYVDKSNKRSEYNPSYGYTFQREGMPEIDTYYENGGKIKVIRNTDNYGIVITAKDAAFFIKDAVQELTVEENNNG